MKSAMNYLYSTRRTTAIARWVSRVQPVKAVPLGLRPLLVDGFWTLDRDVPMDRIGPLSSEPISGRLTEPVEHALPTVACSTRRPERSSEQSSHPLLRVTFILRWGSTRTRSTGEPRPRTLKTSWPNPGGSDPAAGRPRFLRPGIASAPSAGTTANSAAGRSA
jgi:hypothetical protein